jgi:hypothetical protein
MAHASARPDNLDAFALAAADASTSLATVGGSLGEALDACRATAGWSDWLADVPPLDIDVVVANGLGALADGVAGAAWPR